MFKKLVATALGGCLLVAALCLGLLPVTALAAAPIGQVLYVGGVQISSTGYWTTDSAGTVTAFTGEGTPADNFIYYDASRNTLTLHNATIRMSVSIDTNTLLAGAAIGVLNQYGDGNAELTITLEGTNTIAEVGKGIFVLANSASTGSSNLTIQGDGSLNASASQTGIWVQSNSNNAALCVENAEVTASSDVPFKNGVLVQAKDGSDVSLTVNGGSLTASVNANIWFQFGSGTSGSGTPTVTVSNNAIVRANGGIANNSSTSIQYGTGNEENGGIVWNGTGGTVYGSVTLQDDLEIKSGETLTVPDGSSLNCNGNLTNNGTILASGGTVTGSLSGGTAVTTPSITAQPTGQTVAEGSAAMFSVTASNAQTYQWQQSTDNGSSWANIESATSASYTISSTATDMSNYQYRCVVKSASGVGVISNAATLTVHVHAWGEPVWSWSEDGKTATATFTCKNDGSHQATEDAAVTSAVKTPATCTEAGVTTYTATVEFGGETYTSTEDVADVPATGHEFEGGLCSVCGARDTFFSPALVSGDGSKWTKGSSKGLTFVSSAAFADLVEVRLDGRVLSASEYAVREGSTVVTLPAKLLEGLKAGDHELLIVSGSGTVRASLTVAEAAKVEEAAKTEKASADELPASGDSTAPALAVAAAAAAGAGLVLLSRRRAAR